MLTSTLSVAPIETGIQFTLTVTNEGEDRIELVFPSGQRFDIVVEDGGEECWRYSDGRAFVQMLGTETLEPGSSRSYDALWEAAPAGEYEVRGMLTANTVDVEATMDVTID